MMLIKFGYTFESTVAEFRDRCSKAGFSRFKTMSLGGPLSTAVADGDPTR